MDSSAESVADIMVRKLKLEEATAISTLEDINEDEDSNEDSRFFITERPKTGIRGVGVAMDSLPRHTARPTTSGRNIADSSLDQSLLPPRPGSARARLRPQTSSGRSTVRMDLLGATLNSDALKANEDHGFRETLQGTMELDSLLGIFSSQKKSLSDALLLAAEKGDVAAVKSLLAKGASPNDASSLDSFTPLHHAASRGHLDVVNVLLCAGALADPTNRAAETPLHLACYGGHIEVVVALIEGGADVDAKNEYDETPLFYAARKDNHSSVKVLLQHNADCTIRSRFGDKAIDEASDAKTRAAFTTKGVKRKGLSKLDPSHLIVAFSFLEIRDLCKCCCVSTKWQRAAEDSSLWKAKGVQRWNLSLQSALGMEQAQTATMFRPSSKKGKARSQQSGSFPSTPDSKLRNKSR